jgi:hypothetical protein
MKPAAELYDYLTGKRFSTDLAAGFEPEPQDRELRSRSEWLTALVAGKQVIHVGCVDHGAAVIQHKLPRGHWLHRALDRSSARCFGVDTDTAGIRHMREALGYQDVLAANILEDPCEALFEQRWDYLLVPEVLEHIGNPVQFLGGLRRRFAHCVDELVVTVPNAFGLRTQEGARRGIEHINSDHRLWFTPYTLAKIAVDAGLAPRQLLLCEDTVKRDSPLKPRRWLRNARLRHHPLLRKRIVMFATLAGR